MFILNYYSSSNFVYVQKIFRSKLVSFTPGGTITRCWSSATCSEPWTMKNREVCAQPAIQHLNENIKRFQDTRIKVDKIQWERNAVYNAYSLLPTANDLKWHIPHMTAQALCFVCTAGFCHPICHQSNSGRGAVMIGHATWPGDRTKSSVQKSLVCLKCARQNTCTRKTVIFDVKDSFCLRLSFKQRIGGDPLSPTKL